MKIRLLATLTGREGMLYKNHIREVSKDYGEELIRKGYAIEVREENKREVIEMETNVEEPIEIKPEEGWSTEQLKERAKAEGVAGYSAKRNLELMGEPTETELDAEEPMEIKLDDLTVPELKDKAKDVGIVGYSAMRKPELIESLSGVEELSESHGKEE